MTSKIEWTTETWNPLAGCSKISDGCKNCYAIKDALRLAGNPNEKIAVKYEGTAQMENGKMNWTGRINLASSDVLTQPMRWTRPRKIFVNSMSDLFHENVADEWIDKIFAAMALAPQHVFQILTKRPERMRDYLISRAKSFGEEIYAEAWFLSHGEYPKHKDSTFVNLPLKNVWLGVSVENQKAADERIPHLLETPAAVRFLSCEPLLGDINLTRIPTGHWAYGNVDVMSGYLCGDEPDAMTDWDADPNGWVKKPASEWERGKHGINWVIVGGESGHGARPMHPEWVRSIRDQCVGAKVPFFFKQWGEYIPFELTGQMPFYYCPATNKEYDGHGLNFIDAESGEAGRFNGHQWLDPHDAITYNRETGSDDCSYLKVGKKNAGRILDGRTWDEYPKTEDK